MKTKDPMEKYESLIEPIENLRKEAVKLTAKFRSDLEKISPDYRKSAENLLHYLSVRRHDIRNLQRNLHSLGLSSLGRMEAYVLTTLNAVRSALYRLAGREVPADDIENIPVDFETGRVRLAEHTELLLGPKPRDRSVRVMVTLPSGAAERYQLIHDLVESGMNVARINCSQDDKSRWQKMIDHVRKAEKELNRSCRVLMDLAGPNPRTGPMEPSSGVLHWYPIRDDMGQIIEPAKIWITKGGAEPKAAHPILPVPDEFLEKLQKGDHLKVKDTCDHYHLLLITDSENSGFWAEAQSEAFVRSRADLVLERKGEVITENRVQELPPEEEEAKILLTKGDYLVIYRDRRKGCPAVHGENGEVIRHASVSCTLPEMLTHAQVGQRFFYDDGEMGGVIREVDDDRIVVEITQVSKGKIQSNKGINLPDTKIDIPALTKKDLVDLDFIVGRADMVGLSFVRYPEDIEHLVQELQKRKSQKLGIVLKIETQKAFTNLPRILVAAMRCPPVGVMVARGDMGVELGFARMAEVQEEILWLCEAAHLPVIWATQVLENLNKKGLPSRAEVTDAAMSSRAECVMLNKGEHVVETVRFLCEVLQRMQDHQEKKQSLLRKLSISEVH